MANDMNRPTPSGATITDSDYQAIKKEATKDTVKTVLALVGLGAIVIFVRNRMNGKDVITIESNDK